MPGREKEKDRGDRGELLLSRYGTINAGVNEGSPKGRAGTALSLFQVTDPWGTSLSREDSGDPSIPPHTRPPTLGRAGSGVSLPHTGIEDPPGCSKAPEPLPRPRGAGSGVLLAPCPPGWGFRARGRRWEPPRGRRARRPRSPCAPRPPGQDAGPAFVPHTPFPGLFVPPQTGFCRPGNRCSFLGFC